MIMADSICASREFSESFRHEMSEISKLMKDVPEVGKLARIEANDPLFTKEYGGYDIRRVGRRDPATRVRGQPLRREDSRNCARFGRLENRRTLRA